MYGCIKTFVFTMSCFTQFSYNYFMLELAFVIPQNSPPFLCVMQQLAKHSNIALNKETLRYWVVSPQYSKASISPRNKPGTYIKIFTGTCSYLTLNITYLSVTISDLLFIDTNVAIHP